MCISTEQNLGVGKSMPYVYKVQKKTGSSTVWRSVPGTHHYTYESARQEARKLIRRLWRSTTKNGTIEDRGGTRLPCYDSGISNPSLGLDTPTGYGVRIKKVKE